MNKSFIAASIITAIVLFILNAIVFVFILDDFFHHHPAVSQEFTNQLYRPADQLIWWATILSAVAIGFLVTTVIKWSGARSFVSGLKPGFTFSILFLCTVDFGLLASTNNFTTAGAFADLTCSSITVGLSGAVAAWALGRLEPRTSNKYSF
jgi:hypothetical protein